jgi:N-methylhydantoinase B
MSERAILERDPVTFEVIRGDLAAICEEMKSVVMRASFSPLLSLSADLSCAVLDVEGNVVAQGNDIPVHLGAMPFTVRAVLAVYPLDEWRPGDAVIANDPYLGGNHLPDMTVVSAAFADGVPVGFVASRVHWPDVGGPHPGSSSVTDHILKEGLRVPPIRIQRDDRLDERVVALLLANMRMPDARLGDLQAQCAGNRRGLTRLASLAQRYGAATVREVMAAVQEHSCRAVEAGIARLPQGEFEHAECLDGDGYEGSPPIVIRARISRQGTRLRVDFTGSSPCARGPVNAPIAVTASAVYYAVLSALGAGAQPNSGAYRPIDIVAPPGSVVHAIEPFPVVAANTDTSSRIVDVLFGAFAAAGDFALAGSYGCAAVYTLGGMHPGSGRPFVHYETIGGGLGAGPGGSGVGGMRVHMGNTMNLPIEAMEAALPVRFEAYALVAGSGGCGEHRGGDGVCKRIRALAAGIEASVLVERGVVAPRGERGGADGALASVSVERAGGALQTLRTKVRVVLESGDVLEIVTAGGGGWGRGGAAAG